MIKESNAEERMEKGLFFVDIHCHPNLRSYNSGFPHPTRNPWENISGKGSLSVGLAANLVSKTTNNIYKDSQSNLYNLAKGNVKVAIASLYPIENGFLRYRNLAKWLLGKQNINSIYEQLSGVDIKRINYLQESPDGYFEELEREYIYLRHHQDLAPCHSWSYRMASNYSQVEQFTFSEPNVLTLINSIEGAHSYGVGSPATEKMSESELKKRLEQNIGKSKSWEHPPFFVNLAHHFWNQLCGHAPSIKFPVNAILNQTKGLNTGITSLGHHAIMEILSKTNGRRILIDTKHMSIKSRKEYYGILASIKKLTRENIPIICSHTGINKFHTMDESVRERDNLRKSRKSYLHNWSINLSAEEIRIIHQSGGMIGIMMDKGVIGGGEVKSAVESLTDEKARNQEYIKLIWTNIFLVIRAVKQKSAWDIISMGTDYDGGIQHIDHYENAEKMNQLYKDLIVYLRKTRYMEELWYGYDPVEMVNKVMRDNALQFLKNHFN